MARIVTSTYRYKRPPSEKQAVALAGPAVVTRHAGKLKAEPAVTAPPPANDGRKSAIVTTASRTQAKLERAGLREDRPEDPEASAAKRAWLERAKWAGGPQG